MVAQPLKNSIALPLCDFSLHFLERKMDDVVMMDLFAWHFVTQLKPHSV